MTVLQPGKNFLATVMSPGRIFLAKNGAFVLKLGNVNLSILCWDKKLCFQQDTINWPVLIQIQLCSVQNVQEEKLNYKTNSKSNFLFSSPTILCFQICMIILCGKLSLSHNLPQIVRQSRYPKNESVCKKMLHSEHFSKCIKVTTRNLGSFCLGFSFLLVLLFTSS